MSSVTQMFPTSLFATDAWQSNTVMSVKRARLIGDLLGYVLSNRDTAARRESASTVRCSSSTCLLKSINTPIRDDKHTKVCSSSLRLFWGYSCFLELKGCLSPFSHIQILNRFGTVQASCCSSTVPQYTTPKSSVAAIFTCMTTRTPSPTSWVCG